jgi:hypothetical protein
MRGGALVAVAWALQIGSTPLQAQYRFDPIFLPGGATSAVLDSSASRESAVAAPSFIGAAPALLRFAPPSLRSQEPAPGRAPWWTPVASAIVPGSGQLMRRQRRGVPYLAAEAFLLVQYLSVRDDARDFRREYQRLAQVARSFFTDDFPAGDFEYYERMEQFVESGAYDLDPNGSLLPETDTTTFNGFTWRLARRTFWENPDAPPPIDSEAYQRAIEFYQERAVRDEFRWSWQNAQLEQDLFRQTIERSNSAFRRTSQYLGVLIANHALSAIDAFVMVRLSRAPGARSEYRIEGSIPWAPLGRGSEGAGGAHSRK